MMTLGQRLKKIREDLGYNQNDFAAELGISSKTYWDYEKDKSPIKSTFIESLVKKYEINASWLFTGKGEMYTNKEVVLPTIATSYSDCVTLPLITASAGGGYSLISNARISVPMDELKKIGYLIFDNLVIVKISGDSMSEKINDGDILVIDTKFEAVQDGKIYVINYGGELFCKYLLNNVTEVILKSHNKDYPPVSLKGDELDSLKIIGKVIFKMCSFK